MTQQRVTVVGKNSECSDLHTLKTEYKTINSCLNKTVLKWERSRQVLSYKGVSGVTASATSVEGYRDVHGSDIM